MTQVGNNSGGLDWLFNESGKVKDPDRIIDRDKIPGQAPLPGDLDKAAKALPEPTNAPPELNSSQKSLPVRFSNQTPENEKKKTQETGNRSWDLTGGGKAESPAIPAQVTAKKPVLGEDGWSSAQKASEQSQQSYIASSKPLEIEPLTIDRGDYDSSTREYAILTSKILSYLDNNGNVKAEHKDTFQKDIKRAAALNNNLYTFARQENKKTEHLSAPVQTEAEALIAVKERQAKLYSTVKKAQKLWQEGAIYQIIEKASALADCETGSQNDLIVTLYKITESDLAVDEQVFNDQETKNLKEFLDYMDYYNLHIRANSFEAVYMDGDEQSHDIEVLYRPLAQLGLMKTEGLQLGMGASTRDFGLKIDPIANPSTNTLFQPKPEHANKQSLGLANEQFTAWKEKLVKEEVMISDSGSHLLHFLKMMYKSGEQSVRDLDNFDQTKLITLIEAWHKTNNSPPLLKLSSADDILKVALAQHNGYVFENGSLIESSKVPYYKPSNEVIPAANLTCNEINSYYELYNNLSNSIMRSLNHDNKVRKENSEEFRKSIKGFSQLHQMFSKFFRTHSDNNKKLSEYFKNNNATSEASALEVIIKRERKLQASIAEARKLWIEAGIKELIEKYYKETSSVEYNFQLPANAPADDKRKLSKFLEIIRVFSSRFDLSNPRFHPKSKPIINDPDKSRILDSDLAAMHFLGLVRYSHQQPGTGEHNILLDNFEIKALESKQIIDVRPMM